MESFGTCCPQWYKRYSYESLIIITNNWIPNFRRMPSLQHLYMMRKDSLHLDMSTFQNFVLTFIQQWFESNLLELVRRNLYKMLEAFYTIEHCWRKIYLKNPHSCDKLDHYNMETLVSSWSIKHAVVLLYQRFGKGREIAYLGSITSTKLPFPWTAQDTPAT